MSTPTPTTTMLLTRTRSQTPPRTPMIDVAQHASCYFNQKEKATGEQDIYSSALTKLSHLSELLNQSNVSSLVGLHSALNKSSPSLPRWGSNENGNGITCPLNAALASVRPKLKHIIPQLVVIGSQSSGKTCLVERFSGLPSGTLPQGQGIVTRAPLKVHIHDISDIRRKNADNSDEVELRLDVRHQRESTATKHGAPNRQSIGTATPLTSAASPRPSEGNGLSPRKKTISSNSPYSRESFVTFDHLHGRRLPLSEASAEIISRTNVILKKEFPNRNSKHCVTSTPIVMNVYSVDPVVELSFIDLPGLTRLSLSGQSEDMSERLVQLAKSFCEVHSTIILAVTPLNTDIATSESLNFARSVDPRGIRTIGVLTKADLVEEDVDVAPILDGGLIGLSLGFHAVIARPSITPNSASINPSSLSDPFRMPKRSTSKNEDELFQAIPNFKGLTLKLKAKCGVKKLASYIFVLFLKKATDALPPLRDTLSLTIGQLEDQLWRKKNPMGLHRNGFGGGGLFKTWSTTGSTGDPMSNTELMRKQPFLLSCLNNFTRNFTDLLDGRLSCPSHDDVHGGARIQQIFVDSFRGSMEAIDELEGLNSKEISIAIANSSGVTPSLFVPESAFEALVKRQLRLFEAPCLRCVDLVHEELRALFVTARNLTRELESFDRLKSKIELECTELLDIASPAARGMVEQLIEIEHAYIYTAQTSFRTSLVFASSRNDVQKGGLGGPTSNNQIGGIACSTPNNISAATMVPRYPVVDALTKHFDANTTIETWVGRLLRQYLRIVKANLVDSVPKAIMRYLVWNVREMMANALIRSLYKDDQIECLLEVSESQKRDIDALESEIAHLTEIKITVQDTLNHIQRHIGPQSEINIKT